MMEKFATIKQPKLIALLPFCCIITTIYLQKTDQNWKGREATIGNSPSPIFSNFPPVDYHFLRTIFYKKKNSIRKRFSKMFSKTSSLVDVKLTPQLLTSQVFLCKCVCTCNSSTVPDRL